MMKFVREVPTDKITNEMLNLEQDGFTFIWRNDSLEIWVETEGN